MLEFNATFFIAMFSFVIFMMIMNAILYKPLDRIVNARKDLIDKNYMKSKAAQEKYDILQKWQVATMEKAQQTSKENYQRIINDYKLKKESMLEYGRNLSKQEIAVAAAYLDGEVINAKHELKPEVKVLASIIASRVLGYETEIE